MRFETAVPIGRGATGEVFKAWDPQLERWVALKMLHRAEPEAVARMQREARSQARVEHPDVCRVFEVGEHEGRPYIAMEMVEGRPLDLAAEELTIDAKVRLLARVARAVHAAHSVGLIHRDLKPSNILVRSGEEASPCLVDFGLARPVDGRGLTETGQVVGTPGFMAPEQIRGDLARLDRRCDVYGLGAVLYLLLTGRPPFEGRSSVEVWVRALDSDPPSPRRRVPGISRELETIALRCLERDPGRRYPSAKALAEELERYLAGEPILARPPGFLGRGARWVRRHRALVMTAAAGLLSAAVFGALALAERRGAEERARHARRFGQEIERLDAELRLAWSAPLHDVGPSRAAAEARLRELERRTESEGRSAVGPGALALGRGLLALGRPEEARRQLERALAADYEDPLVHLTLGEALAELYLRGLREADRLRDEGRRQRRLAELERDYRLPALEHLRHHAVSGERLGEVPELPRARLALVDGRLQAARELAAAALLRRPWAYEAAWIEARAAVLEGRHLWRGGDYEGTRAAVEEAEAAYGRAVDVARSHPLLLADRCADRALAVDLEVATGGEVAAAVEIQLAVCGRALRADGRSLSARMSSARAHWRLARWSGSRGGDPEASLIAVRKLSREAAELDPEAHNAYHLLGLGLLDSARARSEPRATEALYEQAAAAFARALELHPRHVESRNSLASVHSHRARLELRRGGDPRVHLGAAIRAYEEAIGLDPEYAMLHSNLCNSYRQLGNFEEARAAGGSADPAEQAFLSALAACERALELNPNYVSALVNAATSGLGLARVLGSSSEPAAAALATAIERLERAAEIDSSEAGVHFTLANARQLEAAGRSDAGLDPSSALDAAERALRSGLEIHTAWAGGWGSLGAIELARAEWRAGRGGDPRASLLRARQHQERCLGMAPDFARCALDLAESWRREARYLGRHGLEPATALARARSILDGLPEETSAAARAELEALAAGLAQDQAEVLPDSKPSAKRSESS